MTRTEKLLAGASVLKLSIFILRPLGKLFLAVFHAFSRFYRVPESFRQLSEQFRRVSEEFRQLPENLGGLSEKLRRVPEKLG
jgi:hypothetical protein